MTLKQILTGAVIAMAVIGTSGAASAHDGWRDSGYHERHDHDGFRDRHCRRDHGRECHGRYGHRY
jgi:hypothetical protein